MKPYQRKIIIVFLVFCFGCANQGFPPGGPVDKTPPAIIETTPMPNSTGVPLDTEIVFTFSEPVEKKSAQESFFMTPVHADKKFNWKGGRKLRIRFPGGLRQDRTYVMTIGSGARDYRNNTMQESFTLAFSTGDRLDEGLIRGTVYWESGAKGVQIWAYDLFLDARPNPVKNSPLYVTQAGENGDYRLSHMAFGRYRVIAVADRDMDQLYDPEYDALGVAAGDVTLAADDPQRANVDFRMSRRDTTKPAVLSAQARDRHHIDLRFSESMQPRLSLDPDSLILAETGDSVRVLAMVQNSRNPAYFHLLVEPMHDDTTFVLHVRSARDLAGLSVDSEKQSVSFTGSVMPDTVGPQLVFMQPPDSSENVFLDQSFDFIFSEAMDTASVNRQLVLRDSLQNQIDGETIWSNLRHMTFQPAAGLAGLMTYRFHFPVDSVTDRFGNTFADSVFTKKFTTLDPDTLALIAGTLVDVDSLATGPVVLTARSLSGFEKEIVLSAPGPYRFEKLFPGLYFIEVYRDRDENGRYSYGEVFPYVPAERFTVYADSILLRSRWPNEENDIILPD